MDLKHSFTVPASIDETWAAFQEIESVAECFPGAQIISAEADTFDGTVKVKLGPIALVYKGSGTFTERDEATHTMVIDAKGKDKRGNGTAGARITATMAAVDGGTTVDVVTDLAITGKPAQFGRGVIQDVSDKLLGQFVDCLQAKVGSSGSQDSATDEAAVDTGAPAVATAGAAAAVGGSAAGASTPSTATRTRPTSPLSSVPDASSNDSIDIGAAVVPVLIKSYWKQVVAAVAGSIALGVLVKRLRRD